MKIIVIGAGAVGFQVAESLSKEEHDVTVIDKSATSLQAIASLDVLTIKGSGSSLQVLHQAGVDNADMLIAVTDSDEVNAVACSLAKIKKVKTKLARIRHPDFHLSREVTKELGIDFVINPDKQLALEIGRLLMNPLAIDVEDFADGQVQIIEMKVEDDSSLVGSKVKDVKLPESFLIVAVFREGHMLIPDGDFVIESGDGVFISGKTVDMPLLGSHFGKVIEPPKSAIIVGGKEDGFLLAKTLSYHGLRVKLIEINTEQCQELSERLNKVIVLNGDGTNPDFLRSEGIENTDCFVALTDSDEENLLTALLAKQLGCKKVVAKTTKADQAGIIETVGVDVAINTRMVTANSVLRFVRRGDVISTSLLREGEAEVMEFVAAPGSAITGKLLKDIKFLKGAIIGAISNEDGIVIPHGYTLIKAYDHVVVFTLKKFIGKVERFFKK